MKLFKPEHFSRHVAKISIAEEANAVLDTLIEAAPVVYEFTNSASIQSWIHIEAIGATRKARLIFIEPIVKEPCKHEPMQAFDCDGEKIKNAYVLKCTICGAALQATWSEIK